MCLKNTNDKILAIQYPTGYDLQYYHLKTIYK